MAIKENELVNWIDNFYGYGSWRAPIWFVAYEEAGGDLPEEVAEKTRYFFDMQPTSGLCDLRQLYQQTHFRGEGPRAANFQTLYDYRFGEKAVLHGIWKNLILFAHGYRALPPPDLLDYQRECFTTGDAPLEALINLYPLPSPHNHAWYYSWLDMPGLPFLKSRQVYEQQVYPSRINNLLRKIAEYKPEIIVMYDMNNIAGLKGSIQSHFGEARFKSVKGVKVKIPQHHTATCGDTTLILTTQVPALRHNRVETGFDWYELGHSYRRRNG